MSGDALHELMAEAAADGPQGRAVVLPAEVWREVASALRFQIGELMEIPGDEEPEFIAMLEQALAVIGA